MVRSETQFVEALRQKAEGFSEKFRKLSRLRKGIGDDCAVIGWSSKSDLLITTDLFLEDIHFHRRWMEPHAIGHKTLARGLSDIAAMGGIPRHALLSIGIPEELDQPWIDRFLAGFFHLAEEAKVVLAGGDTGRSKKGFIADIIVLGEAPKGSAVMRSGARVGDEIWVSGQLGNASAGLAILEQSTRKKRNSESQANARKSFLYPQPRLEIGQFLRKRKLATAMMDISDGLSIDLDRLCKASGVGAHLIADWIPSTSLHTVTKDISGEALKRGSSLHRALHGGEDFELLFTVPPNRARLIPRNIGSVNLTRVGTIVPRKRGKLNLTLERNNRRESLPVLGWQHF